MKHLEKNLGVLLKNGNIVLWKDLFFIFGRFTHISYKLQEN